MLAEVHCTAKTVTCRWTHHLGERVGAYCQVVAVSAPRGRHEVQSLHSGV